MLLVLARLIIIDYLFFIRTFARNTVLHYLFVERTAHSLLYTDGSIAARTSFESFEWVVGLDKSHILWDEGGFFLV
jgi:hypothetical protein